MLWMLLHSQTGIKLKSCLADLKMWHFLSTTQTAAMLKMGFAAFLVLALLVELNGNCCSVIRRHKQQ